ncbi:thioredoxin TrxC [Shewanella baltica]|nr:thioredoxin TrxC [Shewanella baltica]
MGEIIITQPLNNRPLTQYISRIDVLFWSFAMIIACPHCDTLNRVPDERVNQQPTCGKCKLSVFTAAPIELTSANFANHANKSELPLVVDFWASWCGPCKSFAPVFSAAAKTWEPQFRFGKLNTEEQQALAAQFNIRSIPTLMIFKQGKILAQQAGALPQSALNQWLKSHS